MSGCKLSAAGGKKSFDRSRSNSGGSQTSFTIMTTTECPVNNGLARRSPSPQNHHVTRFVVNQPPHPPPPKKSTVLVSTKRKTVKIEQPILSIKNSSGLKHPSKILNDELKFLPNKVEKWENKQNYVKRRHSGTLVCHLSQDLKVHSSNLDKELNSYYDKYWKD